MSLQKIIDLVRREDVVLLIGSGFSLYSGYPTGLKFSALLYDALSAEEKENVQAGLPLMDLAEQFVRLKGGSRNELNQLLRKEFTKRPGSLKWHQELAKIPHFKTIITTNYDQLIEQAYGNDLSTVISPPDLAYLGDKIELFKIHGDIYRPDSIIVTRTDYTDIFLHDIPNNLIWANIRARLSNKTLVFVGHDMEDENIKVTLQGLNKALGTNRKEMFLVAPGFKKHKIDYLSQFHIQYVDSKGEIFLEKLVQSLKDNITTDFDRGLVGADTFRRFCQHHQLAVKLSSHNDGFDMKGISAMQQALAHQLSFSVADEQIAQSLSDIASGHQLGKVVIDSRNVKALKMLVNEVNILSQDAEYKITLGSTPVKKGKASIVFDDQSEFEGIHYQLFTSKTQMEIRASYCRASYIFQVPISSLEPPEEPNISFTFSAAPSYTTVKQAIDSLTLGLKLSQPMSFTVYLDGASVGQPFKKSNQVYPVDFFESNLSFFEDLKTIERAYQVRFQNIGEYSKEEFNNAYKVALFAGGGHRIRKWTKELTFEIKEPGQMQVLQAIDDGSSLVRMAQNKEIITIYGVPIDLGYEVVEGLDLYTANMQEVKDGKTKIARVRSKTERVKVYYIPTLPTEGAPLAPTHQRS